MADYQELYSDFAYGPESWIFGSIITVNSTLENKHASMRTTGKERPICHGSAYETDYKNVYIMKLSDISLKLPLKKISGENVLIGHAVSSLANYLTVVHRTELEKLDERTKEKDCLLDKRMWEVCFDIII